ncbi:DALR anticodon-binding domain-containing protein 3 [Plutella xylostella]|uniref:DALR anticodon-binding domain-containing protein 3 n=1 Tax=Plutella xylostella TaxID=51655 RepID=UPI0020330173|nr:DALR anticodon-binding domain-containing protein 3 [Plutella xylostella]
MIRNSFEDFSSDIFFFLTGKEPSQKNQLIKRHTEHLHTQGDCSFPNTLKSWHEYVRKDGKSICGENVTLLKYIGKTTDDLIAASKQWHLKVTKIKEVKDRIHLFFDRPSTIQQGLAESVRNHDILKTRLSEKVSTVQTDPLCTQTDDLTSLRLQCLSTAIENLNAVSNLTCSVMMTSKSSSSAPEGTRLVLAGTVLNAKTGVKESTITAEEYNRLRHNEMTLIAQHKYGVRATADTKLKQFIEHLGQSAVVFELLQIKPSSAIKINFDNAASGSSKGAAFVLYNCARLETMIRTYNDKVKEGVYPALPPFEEADFTLLNQEEEWVLIYNYIMGLPEVLNMSVDNNGRSVEYRPHHICSFLSSMVRVFSQYYRKVRVLTEPRKHLLPVIFSRVHMLIILNQTLKICLNILNIKSVTQM